MREKTVIGIAVLLVLLFGLMIAGCNNDSPADDAVQPDRDYPVYTKDNPLVMTFAIQEPPAGSRAERGFWLSEVIPERSDGRIKFEFYHSGSVYGTLTEMDMALMDGSLSMAHTINFTNHDPRFELLYLPLMFENDTHIDRFYDTDTFRDMMQSVYDNGIIHIPGMNWGNMGSWMLINFDTPITTVEDFQGLKVREPEWTAFRPLLDKVGVSAVQIPIPEVSAALDTGMIDGVITNEPGLVGMGLLEKGPYILNSPRLNYDGWNMFGVFISKAWWDKVPPDLREIILFSLSEASGKMRPAVIDQTDTITAFAQMGATITELEDAEYEKLLELAQESWQATAQELDQAGFDGQALIDKIAGMRGVPYNPTTPSDYYFKDRQGQWYFGN